MARRRRGRRADPGPTGFLVVDKPPGWTSHDVVDAARGWLHTRRVGHMGTLDPAATGVLPLAVRGATKLINFVRENDKTYAGAFHLGVETDTLDAEGRVLRTHSGPDPDEARIREALRSFEGEIEQVPPMFSAVKVGGVPLHKLARKGQRVEREPKCVKVQRFEMLKYTPPLLEIEVDCSGGTYVRVLASDLGAHLGCGAHLAGLRRTRSGPFRIEQALTPEQLARDAERGEIERRILSPLAVLGLPAICLAAHEVACAERGGVVDTQGPQVPPGTQMVAHDGDGNIVGILESRPGRRLKPLRILPRNNA